MTQTKTKGWFRNTVSGAVFEAEGEQYRIALKDKDCLELEGPPANSDEAHPELEGLRERLNEMGVPFSENATAEELSTLIDTQAEAWRAALKAAGVANVHNMKPETLKAKLDSLDKPADQKPIEQ